MTSSYSTDLKLELMVTGENAGTWGDNTNNNLNLIQQAIAGFESVALSDGGTVTLAMTDKTISNARNMVLKFTGTLTTASTVTIPDGIEKFYVIDLSAVTGVTNLTIKTVSGTGFTAGEAAIVAAYSDGTNLNEIALNTLGGTIATAQIADNAVTTAKISNANVTTAKIADNAITTAKISALQVTADKIANSTITQAKLASNSVGADQLISTGVTAAEYTAATITVDADGRITAASSGAGAANMQNVLMNMGPSSSTYSPPAAVSKYQAFAWSAGGGGGGACGGGFPGGIGGDGAFAFYAGSVTGGTNYAVNIGGGGTGGPGSCVAGNAGGDTSIATLFTVNGGGGGAGAPGRTAGTAGTAPGATHSDFDRDVLFMPRVDYNFSNQGEVYSLSEGGDTGRSTSAGGGSGREGALALYDNRG